MRLNKLEQRCVAWLAQNCGRQTGGFFTKEALAKDLGITPDECIALLRMAEAHELLADVHVCDGELYSAFNISYRAVQFQREIEAAVEERGKIDRVEAAKSWF